MYDKNRKKLFRIRGIRNIVLSAMLVLILLITTGCSALLIGDNKKAYDLMIKASSYFKYPSSVQIVSGQMSGESMYCVIRGKNSYGNYRSNAYYVSSSGYPYDEYDSRCYSDKLNCDLINNALAAHFGNSTNFTGNLIGGINMSSGGVIAVSIIALIVVLCLNGLLSSNASDMANDKGYEKRKWFHMCFWLGPISYIIVAAMPDKVMQSKVDQTNKLLGDLLTAQKASPVAQEHAQQADVSTFLPEL